jgi:hypothetical protein
LINCWICSRYINRESCQHIGYHLADFLSGEFPIAINVGSIKIGLDGLFIYVNLHVQGGVGVGEHGVDLFLLEKTALVEVVLLENEVNSIFNVVFLSSLSTTHQ